MHAPQILGRVGPLFQIGKLFSFNVETNIFKFPMSVYGFYFFPVHLFSKYIDLNSPVFKLGLEFLYCASYTHKTWSPVTVKELKLKSLSSRDQ